MNKFAEMTTDQLKNTVEKEIKKSSPDRSTVMKCLQELKRRDADGEPDKVLDSWEKSQQPEAKTAYRGWGRIVAAAAVVAVLLLAVVPQALGAESIFTKIGNWTKEIFSFGEIQEKEFVYQTDHPGLQELYDTVTSLGVEKNVVPTWLPEGYELNQLLTQTHFDSTTVFASYVKGEKYITINIKIFETNRNFEYQKNATDAALYEKSEIKHYIVENDETWTAAWIIEKTECSISVDAQDDLYKMIASIYKVRE